MAVEWKSVSLSTIDKAKELLELNTKALQLTLTYNNLKNNRKNQFDETLRSMEIENTEDVLELTNSSITENDKLKANFKQAVADLTDIDPKHTEAILKFEGIKRDIVNQLELFQFSSISNSVLDDLQNKVTKLRKKLEEYNRDINQASGRIEILEKAIKKEREELKDESLSRLSEVIKDKNNAIRVATVKNATSVHTSSGEMSDYVTNITLKAQTKTTDYNTTMRQAQLMNKLEEPEIGQWLVLVKSILDDTGVVIENQSTIIDVVNEIGLAKDGQIMFAKSEVENTVEEILNSGILTSLNRKLLKELASNV